MDYSKIETWTRRLPVPLWKHRLVLYPINVGNYHWNLSVCESVKVRKNVYTHFLHHLDSIARPEKTNHRYRELMRVHFENEHRTKVCIVSYYITHNRSRTPFHTNTQTQVKKYGLPVAKRTYEVREEQAPQQVNGCLRLRGICLRYRILCVFRPEDQHVHSKTHDVVQKTYFVEYHAGSSSQPLQKMQSIWRIRSLERSTWFVFL